MNVLLQRITAVLRSRVFFWTVVAFVVVEAAWVACTAVYPMAFDEDFHLGLIQVYATHWLPFLGGQPPQADMFGAVARDPSYLYHYLMSFPYRVLAHLTDSLTVQVVVLRLLNVGMFAAGVGLFGRVLRRAGVGAGLTNVSLAVFALIPIVPQLAGQINYDNVLLPLLAIECLLVFRLTDAARQRRVDVAAFGWLLGTCCLASLVKYAVLPIDAAVAAWVLWVLGRAFGWRARDCARAARASWQTLRAWTRVGLVTFVLVGAGLFAQRYVVNIVQYHNITPDCKVVLSLDECSQYAPWNRNYLYAQYRDDTSFSRNPIIYSGQWVYWLWYRLFFVINGPASGFVNYPPLPLPSHAALVVGVLGLGAAAWYGRRIARSHPRLAFLLLVSGVYIVSLWLDDYRQYLQTGQPVAINGRYLLPVLLPLAAGLGLSLRLATAGREWTRPVLAAVVLALFLQGGGVAGFILRSDASWDWPNAAVVRANNGARRVLSPLVWEGDKYYDSALWY